MIYLPIESVEQNTGQIEGLPSNPRQWTQTDINRIAKSLEETPELFEARPLIVYPHADKYVILGGNLRYEGAKKNKMQEVPAHILDAELDVEKLKEIVLKDNSSFGDWDMDALANEWDDLPLKDWGVDIAWDNVFLEETAPQDRKEAEEDDFDEEKDHIEVRCKKGDVWQLGEHRLMCGDSTSEEDVNSLMCGEKAELALTDPPYGIDVVSDDGKVGVDFGVAKKGDYKKVIADDTTETAEKAYHLLKSFANRLIIWGGNYFTQFLPFSDSWLIWDKRCGSGIRNTFADGEMAWCSFHTPIRLYHQLWNGMIREGEHEKRVHPTQKPIKMLGEILNDFSKNQDTVLDLFGGSGSTLLACEKLERKCYMMELDPHYCDVIIARWEKSTGKQAVKLN